jgi:hypothetical protein
MADQELTYEEALRGLSELFGSNDPAPNRRRRRYLLDLKDGKLVFRFERASPLERNEISLMLDQIIDEEFDDDIVLRKLAYLFPGSTFESWHRGPSLTAVLSFRRFATAPAQK